jgi:predicted nuclease of predicted toxin-antitoxin system
VAESIRYHFDEHIPPVIAAALRKQGIDVTTTLDAKLRTRDDGNHLAYCCAERRVLVSRDADFLRLSESQDHCGIVACRRRNLTQKQLIDGLILIHAIFTPEEMKGHVEYL